MTSTAGPWSVTHTPFAAKNTAERRPRSNLGACLRSQVYFGVMQGGAGGTGMVDVSDRLINALLRLSTWPSKSWPAATPATSFTAFHDEIEYHTAQGLYIILMSAVTRASLGMILMTDSVPSCAPRKGAEMALSVSRILGICAR